MIRPQMQIQAELYIHTARESIWRKFTRLADWPAWQPDVIAIQWRLGNNWQEEAQFEVHYARQKKSRYIIRMVSPGMVTVWEDMGPAQTAVYMLHCTDQVGGCKVTLSCTYHGVAVALQWLQRSRRQRQLRSILEALQATSR